MKVKRTTILILVTIWLYACNNSTEDNLNKQTDNSTVKVPSDYELKIKKLNILSANFKGFSTSAFTAYHEYTLAFGNDADHYKPKEIAKFSEVDPNHVQNLKLLNDALEIPVLENLNELIKSYKINARAFSVAINSCERYYTSKGYKNDNFENGKGMHKPVIEIFERFSDVDNLLRVKSNEILEKLELEHLNQLKKDGFKIEYLSILAKKEAEKLNTVLSSIDYSDLNTGELKRLNENIAKIYNQLTELKEAKDTGFNEKSTIYYSDLKEFHIASNELYERKNEQKKFTENELKNLNENKTVASTVEGSPNKVIAKYEDMMRSYIGLP